MIQLISNYRYVGYPVMTNDWDNDRRLAYAISSNFCGMIPLMMCAPGAQLGKFIFMAFEATFTFLFIYVVAFTVSSVTVYSY